MIFENYTNQIKFKNIAAIIKEIAEEKDTTKKIELLKAQKDNECLRSIFYLMFDTGFEWVLENRGGDFPPGFKYFPTSGMEYHLYSVYKKLYVFVKDESKNQRPAKLENMWLNYLMDLDPADADLLIKIKDRIKIDGIEAKTVLKVFPKLFNA